MAKKLFFGCQKAAVKNTVPSVSTQQRIKTHQNRENTLDKEIHTAKTLFAECHNAALGEEGCHVAYNAHS
jgi:serine protease inhibitor ecotin